MFYLVASIILIIVYLSVFILATVLNTTIIAIFLQRKQDTKGVLDRFSLNLSIINIICVFALTPLRLAQLSLMLAHDSELPAADVTAAADTVTSLLMFSSVSTQLLIGANRLVGVVHALRYRALVTSTRGRLLLTASWLLSVLATTAMALIAHWRPRATEVSSEEQLQWQLNAFSITMFLLIFVTPLVLLAITYTKIYVQARSNRRRHRRCLCTLISNGVTQNDQVDQLKRPPNEEKDCNRPWSFLGDSSTTSLKQLNDFPSTATLRQVNNNGQSVSKACDVHSKNRNRFSRGERRTKILFSSIFVIYIVSWLPLSFDQFLLTPAHQNLWTSQSSQEVNQGRKALHLVACVLAISSTCTTPLLYTFISRSVRRHALTLFRNNCVWCWSKQTTADIRDIESQLFRGVTIRNKHDSKNREKVRSLPCPVIVVADHCVGDPGALAPKPTEQRPKSFLSVPPLSVCKERRASGHEDSEALRCVTASNVSHSVSESSCYTLTSEC